MRRLSEFRDLPMPKALHHVVVHHSGGLHEGVADRRSHEVEAATPQILRQRPRFVGFRGNLAGAEAVPDGRPSDELPEVFRERSPFLPDREERLRVLGRRGDFRAVADDPLVVHQPGPFARAVAGDLRRIESLERLPEGVALPEDREPRQPGLEPFEDEELEQDAIVADRDAPFGVVVGGVQRIGPGPGAANRLSSAHRRDSLCRGMNALRETRLRDDVVVWTLGGEEIATSYGANCTGIFGREATLLVDPLIAPAHARLVETALSRADMA